ncbi:MAG: hypothetical protein ACRERC_10570 [Candidatus Binatia bacterium]
MQDLTSWLEAVRTNPMLAIGAVVVLVLGYWLLQRKPRVQREADQRLATLRRDKTDQYTKLRPPS